MSETPPEARSLTEQERHLAAVEALQREYDEASYKWEVAKNDATAMKKIVESKQRALHDYVRKLRAPLPLFDVWRTTPVDQLGLSDGIVMLLQEAGINTVGLIADWTDKGKNLTDIPHIGEQKAEAIRQALDRFWSQRKAEGEV